MEYYSAIKKNEILPFATTWMDLEDITQSEISQTEKDKYCMISNICVILKKKKQLTDTGNRWGSGSGMGEESEKVQTSSYKVNKF